MSRSVQKYADIDHDDSSSGSGTRIGSPLSKGEETYLRSVLGGFNRSSIRGNLHLLLLILSFSCSLYLLFLTVTAASQNHAMLEALKPYAVDIANVTNKTWGYGDMPVKMSKGDKMGGHGHDHGTPTETALDPEDTNILYGNMWTNQDSEFPMSIFPVTSDTLDEQRPDEVVTYERNFLVKRHVSKYSKNSSAVFDLDVDATFFRSLRFSNIIVVSPLICRTDSITRLVSSKRSCHLSSP
jgi:hypothetical protein